MFFFFLFFLFPFLLFFLLFLLLLLPFLLFSQLLGRSSNVRRYHDVGNLRRNFQQYSTGLVLFARPLKPTPGHTESDKEPVGGTCRCEHYRASCIHPLCVSLHSSPHVRYHNYTI
jgi:hypothetical protein